MKLTYARLLAGKTDPKSYEPLAATLDASAGYGRDHGIAGAEVAAGKREESNRPGRRSPDRAGTLFGLDTWLLVRALLPFRVS